MSFKRPEWLLDMPAEEYFAEPCEVPALSKSTANTLLNESPKHAYDSHPALGGKPTESTDEMDAGDVIHALVFNQPLDHIEKLAFEDFRKKEAREARDAAKAAGKIPILNKKFVFLEIAANAIKAKLAKRGIIFDGVNEGTILWHDANAAGELAQCRSRLDHVTEQDGFLVIYDMKSTENANPKKLQRTVTNFGYDIQNAAYIRAIEEKAPEWAGRIKFVFLFVELKPPYSVVVAELSSTFRALGLSKWKRAVNQWSECLKTGIWPSYEDEKVIIEAPSWEMHDEIENSASESSEESLPDFLKDM